METNFSLLCAYAHTNPSRQSRSKAFSKTHWQQQASFSICHIRRPSWRCITSSYYRSPEENKPRHCWRTTTAATTSPSGRLCSFWRSYQLSHRSQCTSRRSHGPYFHPIWRWYLLFTPSSCGREWVSSRLSSAPTTAAHHLLSFGK